MSRRCTSLDMTWFLSLCKVWNFAFTWSYRLFRIWWKVILNNRRFKHQSSLTLGAKFQTSHSMVYLLKTNSFLYEYKSSLFISLPFRAREKGNKHYHPFLAFLPPTLARRNRKNVLEQYTLCFFCPIPTP